MNADDAFRYGHLTLLGCFDGLPDDDWETPGVCGVWSTKDVVAHLASYELATGDVFASLLGDGPTPYLDLLREQGPAFNDEQVAQRRGQTPRETRAEYLAANEWAAGLLRQISPERRREVGSLPWYGAEYDLEDAITYMSYGHKREHGAQIAEFRCRVESSSAG